MKAEAYLRIVRIIGNSVIIMFVSLSVGCATRPNAGAPIFYPPAPSIPRLQYLTSYAGSADITRPNRLLEFLVGRMPSEAIAKPYGAAIHDGKIYVCDVRRAVIWIFDLVGKRMGVFTPSGGGKLMRPINITIDKDGTTYVTDVLRGQLLVYDAKGKCIDMIGHKDKTKPIDVVVTEDRFFVSDAKNRNVSVYDKKTRKLLSVIPKRNDVHDEKLFSPTSLAVDSKGAVYVSDILGFRVQKYNADGTYLQTFGAHGDRPGEFARPKGIALDRNDRLYAVDAAAHVVQVFNPAGQLLMHFGEIGGSPIVLALPSQVVIDYDNVDLFREYAAEGFELEYLVLVVNQLGPRKVSVYGFGHQDE